MIDLSATSRRDFMRTTGGVVMGAAVASFAKSGVAETNSETLKVGLIGAGGRGTGAAREALLADSNVQLVAVGDAFMDMAEEAVRKLKKKGSGVEEKIAAEVQLFDGFDNYKGVIAASDVVVLAAPPAFRPGHLRAAIEAGKHVFCEKPIAVDPVGVRHVLETCELARKKGLTIVSGLCYRYENAKRDIIQRIHDGAIGEIVSLETAYNTGGLWLKERKDGWTEMEYQLRNWLYFDWLSGDHINEQHIHSLDKIAWAMGDVYPVKATASGGRIQRVDPKYGNIYDHFNTVYEWPDGLRGFSSCRQWNGSSTFVNDHLYGTKGTAYLQDHRISFRDGTEWKHEKSGDDNMYQNEHNELFACIRNSTPKVDEYMCHSTMMAIMGRISAYTGKTVTLEEMMASDLDLMPKELAWGDVAINPVAVPGDGA
jgi:myo-inositol 2-dehydrogenase/D-chiro-inositol 1-dehydrogenase